MIENDQTIKADAGKLDLTLVPRDMIREVARIRMYGVGKYGASESWRKVSLNRYRAAAYRHFMAYLDDPHGVDEESGLPHLSHLACNIAFLIDLEKGADNGNRKELIKCVQPYANGVERRSHTIKVKAQKVSVAQSAEDRRRQRTSDSATKRPESAEDICNRLARGRTLSSKSSPRKLSSMA